MQLKDIQTKLEELKGQLLEAYNTDNIHMVSDIASKLSVYNSMLLKYLNEIQKTATQEETKFKSTVNILSIAQREFSEKPQAQIKREVDEDSHEQRMAMIKSEAGLKRMKAYYDDINLVISMAKARMNYATNEIRSQA